MKPSPELIPYEVSTNSVIQQSQSNQADWSIGFVSTFIAIGSAALIVYIYYVYKPFFRGTGNLASADGLHRSPDRQADSEKIESSKLSSQLS